MKYVLILTLFVLASFTEAADRARLELSEVVRPASATAKSESSKGIRVTVKDERLIKSCDAAWYETDVTCAGTVKFQALDVCDKPVSAERVVEDCGSIKKTVIKFCSGRKVEIRRRSNHVEVDYDRD